MRPTIQILDMLISYDWVAKKLWLSQERYIWKVLPRFHIHEVKVVSTPLTLHFKLSYKQTPSCNLFLIASTVGSLIYVTVCTNPDVMVGAVSSFFSYIGLKHWKTVKWILKYLRDTSILKICFRWEGCTNVEGTPKEEMIKNLSVSLSPTLSRNKDIK